MAHQIVPLPQASKHHAALLAAGTQQLVYHGGPMLTSVQIKAVFWGNAWTTDSSATALSGTVEAFLQWIVTSTLLDKLSEYSTAGQSIGHGAYRGSVNVPGPVAASIADGDVQTMLSKVWQSESALGPNALWVVLLPPKTQISAFNERSCVDFCGYHDAASNTAYAVAPFPDCAPCLGGMVAIDSLTSVLSHEICEAITDPFGNGWYAASGYEIGDLCAAPTWQTKRLGGYTVQKEWSNKQNACV